MTINEYVCTLVGHLRSKPGFEAKLTSSFKDSTLHSYLATVTVQQLALVPQEQHYSPMAMSVFLNTFFSLMHQL